MTLFIKLPIELKLEIIKHLPFETIVELNVLQEKIVDKLYQDYRKTIICHIETNSIKLLKYLINKQDLNVNLFIDKIYTASINGELNVVKYLLGVIKCYHYSNTWAETSLELSIISGNLEIVRYLVEERKAEKVKLHINIVYKWFFENEYIDVIRYLLEKDAIEIAEGREDYGIPDYEKQELKRKLEIIQNLIELPNLI